MTKGMSVTTSFTLDDNWITLTDLLNSKYIGTTSISTQQSVDRSSFRRPALYCAVGTLSLVTAACLQSSTGTSNWNINTTRVNNIRTVELGVPVASSPAGDIAFIRAVTKISISELARVFGVSRQSIHEWINEGSLSPKNERRVSNLAKATVVLADAGVEVTPQILRRGIGGGPSLLEAVAEDVDLSSLANRMIATLRRESAQRALLATRLAGRAIPEMSDSDFAMMQFREDT